MRGACCLPDRPFLLSFSQALDNVTKAVVEVNVAPDTYLEHFDNADVA